jgi:hypothetical protein
MRTMTVAVAFVLALMALAAPASAQAAPGPTTLAFTGAGGAVPDGNPAGASFNLTITHPALIPATGNNVSLTLIGVSTNDLFGPGDFWFPFGGLADFRATLEHVGGGAPREAFANVLNNGNFICAAGLNGTYTFASAAPTTLRAQCGAGDVFNQPRVIAPGTYRTTGGDDVTDSNLSSAWNAQRVAGTWRLHLSDTNVGTRVGQFVLNTTWTWRLDIQVAGGDSCKQGGWRAFGVFKNQGDCVSFFATGGKNPPAGSGGKKPKPPGRGGR